MVDSPKQHVDADVEKEPIPGISEEAIRSGSATAGGVTEKILEHSHDADAAMKAFANFQGQVLEIDEATNARLLRKIDWHLMPVRSSFMPSHEGSADHSVCQASLHSVRPELPRQNYG